MRSDGRGLFGKNSYSGSGVVLHRIPDGGLLRRNRFVRMWLSMLQDAPLDRDHGRHGPR